MPILICAMLDADIVRAAEDEVLDAPAGESLGSWGAYDPGTGFLVGETPIGNLTISAYGLFRYINQLPADQSFTDHLGVERKIDTRNDLGLHRAMVHFLGWMFVPKLRYQFTVWTVNATEQIRLIGSLGYRFNKSFNLYGGVAGLPGTRTLTSSHPYWLGHDRTMADEFFRPGFTSGVWANGEPLPGLFYMAMVGNNISTLGVSAAEDTRDLAVSGTLWWLPTTGEFGPKGGKGDYELHEKLALRLGASGTHSREDRFNQIVPNLGPESTQIRAADSLLFFQTGALAPDVTVQAANYTMVAADASLKWHGIFLNTEFYNRWLWNLDVDGPAPVDLVHDWGFYVEASVFAVPKRLEVYGSTSWVFGDRSAGYSSSNDIVAGMNLFPFDSRNSRLGLQAIAVRRSPTSSTFGYYIGGQTGLILSLDFSLLF